MTTDYVALNKAKRKHKSALTRARNSGDPYKVIAACGAARLDFEHTEFPDNWPTWTIALADVQTNEASREVWRAAQAEEDAWQ